MLMPHQDQALLAAGRSLADGSNVDPEPIVRVLLPDASATWLLAARDPEQPDRVYGLLDPGDRPPELGWTSWRSIVAARGALGRVPVVDAEHRAVAPLSHYVRRAVAIGLVPD